MALVLVFEEKDFPVARLRAQLDNLTKSHHFLYENLTALDESAYWTDCTLVGLDLGAPIFYDHHWVFHYLVVDLLAELPELLAYAYHPSLNVKNIDEEHLDCRHFNIAFPC